MKEKNSDFIVFRIFGVYKFKVGKYKLIVWLETLLTKNRKHNHIHRRDDYTVQNFCSKKELKHHDFSRFPYYVTYPNTSSKKMSWVMFSKSTQNHISFVMLVSQHTLCIAQGCKLFKF